MIPRFHSDVSPVSNAGSYISNGFSEAISLQTRSNCSFYHRMRYAPSEAPTAITNVDTEIGRLHSIQYQAPSKPPMMNHHRKLVGASSEFQKGQLASYAGKEDPYQESLERLKHELITERLQK